MATDIKKLAEELVGLTVLEVNELKNVLKDEYGIDDTDWNAMIMVELGRLNLDTRSIVWRNNSVTYRGDGTVDPNSAEYRVVRVLPSNTVQRYLLQKVVDGNENN